MTRTVIYLLRTPDIDQQHWDTYRHCWTKFSEDAAQAVMELPFSEHSQKWVEEQARRNQTGVHVAVSANFIPAQSFWDELDYLWRMGKRAAAEEVTNLVFRESTMEPDLEPQGKAGRSIRIYRGKWPNKKGWWDQGYKFQYLFPMYFDGDPLAPGYKLSLGRILPVFWRGMDYPSGRAVYGDGEFMNRVAAATRWKWFVEDWERWLTTGRSLFWYG